MKNLNLNDPQKMNVKLSDAQDVYCNECNSSEFEVIYRLKRLSPLQSPTNRETFIPIQLFRCANCKVIPEIFLEEIKDAEGKEKNKK